MVPFRIVDRPAFDILGKKTYISGPDNAQFGHFWQQSRAEGLLERLNALKGSQFAGPQTGAALLGVSRVEQDPARRDFFYMIAVEAAADGAAAAHSAGADNAAADLEHYQVPASRWAVFECHGQPPDSIVTAEIFAFTEWLPTSGYRHALAPEMEVYPASAGEDYCEFWLPVEAA